MAGWGECERSLAESQLGPPDPLGQMLDPPAAPPTVFPGARPRPPHVPWSQSLLWG